MSSLLVDVVPVPDSLTLSKADAWSGIHPPCICLYVIGPAPGKVSTRLAAQVMGTSPHRTYMKELIPEVIDLVEVLAEIAASMKPHSSEIEQCKTNPPKVGITRTKPLVTLASLSRAIPQQVVRQGGKT